MKCLEATARPLESASANLESFAKIHPNPTRGQRLPFLTLSRSAFDQLSGIAATLGIGLERLESVDELRRWLALEQPPAVLTDCVCDDGDWRDVLALCREHRESPAVIVTARTDSASLWAEVAQAGAVELLARPFYASEVRRCLHSVREMSVAREVPEPTI